MNIKPLVLVRARYPAISGGYRRLHEILKRGKSEGVNYVLVTDRVSYENYAKIFPDFPDICRQYRTYFVDPQKTELAPSTHRFFRIAMIHKYFLLSLAIARIAQREDADLIVGIGEDVQVALITWLSGKICRKPWTTIIQGEKFLFPPTNGLGPLNPFNILNHVSQKKSTSEIRFLSRIGFSIELLGFLRIAEKSLILTVSTSLYEEIRFLNPKIQFHVIVPGNGVDLGKFNKSTTKPLYDAMYFSRLTPEKGLLDLPEICEIIVQRFPKARMLVAGPVVNPEILEDFKRMIHQYDLTSNIVLLGEQDLNSLIDLVCSSKLTIYPSTLDAYGLVVLESLACGRPVVAYDIPAIRENFANAKAVLRCPVKDKVAMAKNIQFLLENEDFRISLSKEAREYVSKLDWSDVVNAEKEAYFTVIEWFDRRARRRKR